MRREHWGGFAFHRGLGELLELDEQGFEALATLSQATRVRDFAAIACCEMDARTRPGVLALARRDHHWARADVSGASPLGDGISGCTYTRKGVFLHISTCLLRSGKSQF